MLQEVKDYTKCAIKNKFILSSYVGIGASLLSKYIEHKTGTKIIRMDDLLINSSVVILGTTQFGLETMHSYRRMREHIKKHGTIRKRFKEKFSPVYCTQTGIKMAAKEAGLENLI